jgi:hypothetical protein
MLQFALIPVAVWLARRTFRRPVVASRSGSGLLTAAVLLLAAVTVVANRDPVVAFAAAWTEPRYLAHSVRELVTFPLTYYPLPLAVLLAREPAAHGGVTPATRVAWLMAGLLLIFAAGFGYQVIAALGHDIGALAQRPDFAVGGRLGIPYLLASHAFEHLLDSIFFALVTLLLVWRARGTGTEARES